MNLDEVEYLELGNKKKFQCKLGPVGQKIGAKRLGYNVTVVPPGKCAFPYHLHHTNEEMFMILEGSGTLRYDGKEYPLKKGDVIACPAGPNTAHQIQNTSKTDLKYFALSTMDVPEVAEYPDSGKVGVTCGKLPSHYAGEPDLRIMVKKDSNVDYFEGEE